MNPQLLGAMSALGVTLGGYTIVDSLRSKAKLSQRVLPHVRAASPEWSYPRSSVPGRFGHRPFWSRNWQQHAGGLLGSLGPLLEATLSSQSAQRRLVQAGREPEVPRFRLSQLRWALAASVAMLVLGLVRGGAGSPLQPMLLVTFCGLAAAAGAVACVQSLIRAAERRTMRVAKQLPTFAELLAFSVAAGMSPAAALSRVAWRLNGELAGEFRRCTAEIAQGRPFSVALQEVADRTCSPSVQRFVDGVVVAVERGTPIAQVLRAQAMDARAAGHRALMESAGRREVYSLVPVVFLILPMVIVIAVFPGIHGLVVLAP